MSTIWLESWNFVVTRLCTCTRIKKNFSNYIIFSGLVSRFQFPRLIRILAARRAFYYVCLFAKLGLMKIWLDISFPPIRPQSRTCTISRNRKRFPNIELHNYYIVIQVRIFRLVEFESKSNKFVSCLNYMTVSSVIKQLTDLR